MRPVPTTRHDVVVVGARPAGAATAMLLARAGLDVLVVDRSRYGSDRLSTHALMRGGVVQLQRWGLLDAVIAAGTPPVRRTTFTYAEDEVTVTIKPSHGVDALYAPRRTLLDPLLVDGARAAGALIEYGISVHGVTRDATGRVNGIEGRDEAGKPVRHTARWVVGADGLRSVVAAAVDAPVEERGTGATAVIYGYWPGFESDGYQWVFRREACAGVIPTNGDQACVFASAPPATIGRGGMTALRRVLRAASPALADRVEAAVSPTGLRTFGGQPGYIRVPWGPGWVLVGDAGYWKDPIGAHGITAALRDAELAARAVIAAHDGTMTEAEALDQFHQTRNRISRPLFEVTDTIASLRWRDAEIPELLLQLASAMSDEVELVDSFDDLPALVGGQP